MLNKSLSCPLCGSPLSKATYDRVTNLDAERVKALREAHRREEKLARDLKCARTERDAARDAGIRAGRDTERKRSERLVQGLEQKLALANERIRQLGKGSTPQTEGLEFEQQLVARLRREFPDDRIRSDGRRGDVLLTVMIAGVPAGLILYECKRTKKIERGHIEQASRDKRACQADFAVLVTTGTRSGFNGFCLDSQVLIAAPLCVVAVTSLMRAQLVEMARARLAVGERERRAAAALEFISGPIFRGPVSEAMTKARRAQELLLREYRDHVRIWSERWGLYQTIDLDLASVADNVVRIRDGLTPQPLERATPRPLELPAVTGNAS